MRGSSIKVSDSEGVFTLSQQVCVNMKLVKYKTGLLPLLSQTKQIQITRTAEMGGIVFFFFLFVCLESFSDESPLIFCSAKHC